MKHYPTCVNLVRKFKGFAILYVLAALACSSFGEVGSNWIEQFGIRWTFDQSISTTGDSGTYQYGQFANGDYWVVGPVNITAISPQSQNSTSSTYCDGGTGNPRLIHGSQINPQPSQQVGYDSDFGNIKGSNCYNAGLNVALGVSSSNPLSVPVHSSLVSTQSMTISELNATGNRSDDRPRLKTCAILTVLPSAAPAGSFRPAYCGTDKSIRYNMSNVDYSLLGSYTPVASTPALSTVERMFERPWLDHLGQWQGRSIHPVDNMQHYGRDLTNEVSIGALMLHLNYSASEKNTLLARYVQMGIDMFGIYQGGATMHYRADGGHASGRKWPILFAGMVLGDDGMMNIGSKSGNYLYTSGAAGSPAADYFSFGEDDQTFFVSQADVNRGIYNSSQIGLAEWGIRHAREPNRDSSSWTASYRQCCTATSWQGFVLAARMMGAQELWNHDALFDYMDRYMATETSNYRAQSAFGENMWDTYRNNLGSVGTTPPPAEDTTPPNAPVNLTSPSQTATSITLSWTAGSAASDGDVAVSYLVFRNGGQIAQTTSASYTNTGLAADNPYAYSIYAVDDSGNVSTSATTGTFSTQAAAPLDTTPPNAPVNLTSPSQTTTSITLSWTASSAASDGDLAVSYLVFRNGGQIAQTTSVTYTNTALVADNPYAYSIYAVDDSGNVSTAAATGTFSTAIDTGSDPDPTNAIYISPSGDSSNNGADWANALRQLPSSLSRGTTYYVAGGSYSGYTFGEISGTDPIIIQKATATDHGTDTGWISSWAAAQVVFGRMTFSGASYITIDGIVEDGMRIYYDGSPVNAASAIYMSNNTRYITIRNADVDGNYLSSGSYQSSGSCNVFGIRGCNNITVENCKIHNAADDGLEIYDSNLIVFKNNEIYDMHSAGTDMGNGPCYNGHSDAVEMYNVTNSQFIGNFIHNIPNTSGFFFGNWASSTSDYCENISLINNIIYNNTNTGFAAYIEDAVGVYLYNNVIWGQAAGAYHGLSLGRDVSDLHMYNNILLSVNFSHIGGSYNASQHHADYNVIGSDIGQFPLGTNDIVASDPGFVAANTATGSVLTTVEAGYFQLEDTSPAIDQGMTIASVSDDIDGAARPAGSTYDIGAYEIGGTTPPPPVGNPMITAVNAYLDEVVITLDQTAPAEASQVTSYAITYNGGQPLNIASCSVADNSITLTTDSHAENVTYTVSAQFAENTMTYQYSQGLVWNLKDTQTFNGVDDFYQLPTDGLTTGDGTVSLWANLNDTTKTSYLFGHTVGTWSNRIQLYAANEQLNLGLGASHSVATNIAALNTQIWYLVTLTWNGSDYTVYVDGQPVSTGTYTGLSEMNTFADLGNTGNTTARTTEVLNGLIDEVTLFSRALSAREVQSLYDIGRNNRLTAYYRLDEHAGSTVNDVSENDNTGTIINNAVWGDAWAQEHCLIFDGTNQAIEIPTASLSTQAGTIAMTVQPTGIGDTQFLFGHSLNGQNVIWLYTVNGQLAVGLGDNSALTTDIAVLNANQLYHVVLCWDNGTYSVSIDSTEVASGSYTGLTTLNTTADIANIGIIDQRGSNYGFDGIVEDIRLYSRALSAQDITALHLSHSVDANKTIEFIVAGTDIQGNPLTYTVGTLPLGAAFDTATQTLTWKPWHNQTGEHQVTFTSTDQSDQQTVTLSVEGVTLNTWYQDFLEMNSKL